MIRLKFQREPYRYVEDMIMRPRNWIGLALMIVGPAVVLYSPWFFASSSPLRALLYHDGWALTVTDQGIMRCFWNSNFTDPTHFAWVGIISSVGVAVLFTGLRLFRSGRALCSPKLPDRTQRSVI
ncbi:hypothetical protein GC207_12790 [bacterium]|nr:hypothetical protein [bacterium]